MLFIPKLILLKKVKLKRYLLLKEVILIVQLQQNHLEIVNISLEVKLVRWLINIGKCLAKI